MVRRLKMEVLTAVAAWALSSTCMNLPVPRSWLGGNCAKRDSDFAALSEKLSSTAQIYFPGSAEFTQLSARWSVLDTPTVNVVVVPTTENDIVETIKYANSQDLPFLAYNGLHGAITTLGKMTSGIEIYLGQLSSVNIAEDGQTVTIGGGTMSKLVTDTLWAAGKQTVTGTCECVSYLGPALGGGHGWLQGHHGLVADQFVSMNVVLADGTTQTINESSDLWWAMKGAGHNFGIVTSVTSKIYDIQYSNWAIETLIFSGDQVEEVYQAANDHYLKDGAQPEGVINWSYWLNIPAIDADKPVILFYIIQEGVTSVDSAYTEAFHNIGPLSVEPVSGTYLDLAEWTGIALNSTPCLKLGTANPRFPIYVPQYNATAQKAAYDLFAAEVSGSSAFNNSLFMFEGYSEQGVQAVDSDSSAFAFRSDNLLLAPLITYESDGGELDARAASVGNQLRQILHDGTGRSEVHTYLNYAFGDETPEQIYGSESWRLERLRTLKAKYDPQGKFSFYGPVA
ncbi:FAD-binding domain-containing protein [Thozetella sp. PMI_491]|nr:FAD-binding domain-containing protein [Thozetella sp. PMI_491]